MVSMLENPSYPLISCSVFCVGRRVEPRPRLGGGRLKGQATPQQRAFTRERRVYGCAARRRRQHRQALLMGLRQGLPPDTLGLS